MKRFTFTLLFTFLISLTSFSQNVVYNFDTDLEGWLGQGGILENDPVGGVITLNTVLDGGDEALGAIYPDQDPFSVNTNNVKTIHVTLKNESTGNNLMQIRLFTKTDAVSTNITTSDSNFKTYSIDLTQLPGFVGSDFFDFELYFLNETSGVTSVSGDILIDKIEFTETALSIKDNDLEISKSYPSPVIDKLTIDTRFDIDSATVFNQLGQQIDIIRSHDILKNTLDLSKLNTGLYFVTLKAGNNSSTLKIIKK
ncbi:hypothetical protein A8C32_16230 [Flavivirga aquatica]|uniref:Secretion system C-terminal sorting domain-containing protein n=1 Tax=Flavivirga aquatica TaxID=1849968 RepID=A0A1E5T9G1_9FLAO|nr:T9SS type A sorting domain-containing protein [Flavivirga aquatica]OEK08004.1 hypothetical protein A8C32_16230 [Flavivirga aquatica]